MYGRKQTLYDVLGVTRDARPDEIVRSYRRLAAEMKRDTTAPDPRRAEWIHEAYEVLSDPYRRAAYDETLKGPRFLGVAAGDKPRRKWGLLAGGITLALGALYYYFIGSAPEARRQAPGLSLQEVQTAASVSVGRVNRVEMSGARSNLGTAVAIEEGVMMAPCQGIGPGVQVIVRIPPRDIPAQLRHVDDAMGLCKLGVSGGGSWPLPTTALAPRVGDRIYAANLNALGEVVVSPGEVKKVVRGSRGRVIETTARAGRPVDGSPLLDVEGRIVAIALDGEHTMLPPAWVVDAPIRKRPSEAPAPREVPAQEPAAPGDANAKRLENVPLEKRERLEKAFRPPPSVPSDL
jgi:DnaJ-like protein/trypsin-like peptidase